MLTRLLLSFAVLALLLGGWVTIQAAARRIAARHPEAGPYREAGGGCGGGCGGHASCGSGDGDADNTTHTSTRVLTCK